MDWLNYHHLYYFWTVMHEGSLTLACKRLRLAPSTVSLQIGKLEESLGGKLFRRVGRGLEPTDLGRTVFRYAEEVFSLGREMMEMVKKRALIGRMSLKVGVVNVLSKLVVRKILAPALKLPQHVHLVCYENKSDTLLADLLVHRLDIVLSDSPVQKSLNIKTYSRLLGECGITFFAGKSLARSVRFGFPQSLDRAPMLLPLEMTALRQSLERWFECLDIMPTIVGEFEDRELLEAFGQNGDGVFAVPSVIEEEMGRQYNVELVGRTDAVRERFYAISFERIVKHPAVTAISDRARKYFGTDKQ